VLLICRFNDRSASFLVLPSATLRSKYARPSEWGLANLTDRGEMQRVVETTVSALGEPVHDTSTRRAFDGCGAVVRRVPIAVGEAMYVAGEADQRAGDHGSDAEDVGERRPRRLHRDADPPM
jgi:hypothetical protein